MTDKKIKVVIGANFGDEGKGLMTDYFCNQFGMFNPILNVRFNGGAQAGHTVVTPEGRRHVFSHFGSGSFNPNVATYLSSEFIVNPILFRREYEELVRLGARPLVYMHPRCLLTIPQDMMVNQIVERFRGAERHGSCGVGIFETLFRSKTDGSVFLDTALDGQTIVRLTDRDYSDWHLDKLGVSSMSDKDKGLLSNQNIAARYCEDVRFLKEHVILMDEEVYNRFDYIVFEGAQGLMLDQNNMDYFPHLTPSNTGAQNVADNLKKSGFGFTTADIEICYVSRTYCTRHGAGVLLNEVPRWRLPGVGVDKTNFHNEFQGGFRYGLLDLDRLNGYIECDSAYLGRYNPKVSVAYTHADETRDLIYIGLKEARDSIPLQLAPKATYVSRGETRVDIKTIK